MLFVVSTRLHPSSTRIDRFADIDDAVTDLRNDLAVRANDLAGAVGRLVTLPMAVMVGASFLATVPADRRAAVVTQLFVAGGILVAAWHCMVLHVGSGPSGYPRWAAWLFPTRLCSAGRAAALAALAGTMTLSYGRLGPEPEWDTLACILTTLAVVGIVLHGATVVILQRQAGRRG